MREPMVAGNWKMNLTNPEAVALVRELLAAPVTGKGCEVVVCPPAKATVVQNRRPTTVATENALPADAAQLAR